MKVEAFKFLVISSSLVLLPVSGASAATFGIADLFNTGLDGSGSLLGNGATDPNYSFTSTPSGAASPASAITSPPGPWVANDSNSRWIGPDTINGGGPAGNYRYQTSFTIANGKSLTDAEITGLWAADNSARIFLNGNDTGITTTSFNTKASFTISDLTFFTFGTNTLEFVVTNSGTTINPTGLLVDELNGTYSTQVPEPITILGSAAALGFGGLFRKKFSKKS